MDASNDSIQSILGRIYGKQKGREAFKRLAALIGQSPPVPTPSGQTAAFTQADAILITYGDSLSRKAERPLKTLHRFCDDHCRALFSGIHILPFFPFSSDDGFSITDFQAVRPDLGDWADIRAIGQDFKLMVDLVANHVSARSRWFQAFLAGEKGFGDLALEVDPKADLSGVIRPRTLPLLTEFTKGSGRRVHLWTTFSADQIDLNYQSLDVLEKMVRTLLLYVSQGARMIRLDAIAYLWKQLGTPCIHLPQTHDMVRLFRHLLDQTAPDVALITETNVPHDENIGYFGNGTDEAQLVYNFSLPPLLLYALATGRADLLSAWARDLATPSAQTTFFNFTASHDGIGVRPLEGLLPADEIAWLADRVRRNGGRVSERANPDGSGSPYELNITYLDACRDPAVAEDPMQVSRFLASQAVALALPGVPAVYVHSLLGSRNWLEGVRSTGRARTINRAKLDERAIRAATADRHSRRARIFRPYAKMLRIRRRQPAFSPAAGMQILDLDPRVFAAERICRQQRLLALTNFGSEHLAVDLPGGKGRPAAVDLLAGEHFDDGPIPLSAYQTRWLTPLDQP